MLFQSLCDRLSERVEASNVVSLSVEWTDQHVTMDNDNYDKYFTQLTHKYYCLLKDAVDRILPKKLQDDKQIVRVISRGQYQILLSLSLSLAVVVVVVLSL